MGMITNDWLDAISGEFKKPYYRELYNFVQEEYSQDDGISAGRGYF